MTYSLGITALEVRQRTVEHADPTVRAMAQEFVDQGNTAFRANNFDEAIRRYMDAWTLHPAPNMLVIIGLTMLRQGRFREASFRFQRYLRENPEGELRRRAQEFLAEAQVAMERGPATASDMTFTLEEAEGRPAAAPPPPPPEIPPDVLEAKRASIRTARQVQQQAPPPTSVANPYAERPPYGVWIATGVGVVGLVGLGWWLMRRKKKPKVNRRRRRRR